MEVAVMSCNNSTFEKLKEKYYNTELELIYVRNFVLFEGGEIFIMEKNAVLEKVYSYLSNELQEAYILEKFTEFEAKYSKNVEAYADCEDPNLAQLTQKFENLVENIQSMGTQIEKTSANQWSNTINTSPLNTGVLFQQVLNKRLSEIPPKPSVLSIITGVQDGTVPETGDGTTVAPTTTPPKDLFALTEELIKQEDTYIKTRTMKELMAEYEALYKNSGDSISKEFEDAINKLNTTIEDTYPHIDTLKQCTKSVTDKQCQ
jgi:chaperonin cofactor prefoldin